MRYKVKFKDRLVEHDGDGLYAIVDADSPARAALNATAVEPAEVELKLTLDELKTLRAIFYKIGGAPVSSRRKHVIAMSDKIMDLAGSQIPSTKDMNGSIYFEPVEEPGREKKWGLYD